MGVKETDKYLKKTVLVKDFLVKLFSSIISAIVVALVFFVWNDYFYKTSDICGVWEVETKTTETTHKEYQNLTIFFDALLQQNSTSISGTGEKTSEVLFQQEPFEYERTKRVQIEINGNLKNNFLRNDYVVIHWMEHGRMRETSTIFYLEVIDKNTMKGEFVSTAANSKGTGVWRRKQ
jgi:hypothetical protein